jgi:hypothetical protein
MAKKLGKDYRLWIESSVAGTYNEIKGQVGLKISRKASGIDSSSKEDFPYGTELKGRQSLTIDFDIKPDLPDTNGYTRFESQAKLPAPTNFQIRKNGSAGADPGDVVFAASMNIMTNDADLPDNDVVKASGQLTLAAAPSVDALS